MRKSRRDIFHLIERRNVPIEKLRPNGLRQRFSVKKYGEFVRDDYFRILRIQWSFAEEPNVPSTSQIWVSVKIVLRDPISQEFAEFERIYFTVAASYCARGKRIVLKDIQSFLKSKRCKKAIESLN